MRKANDRECLASVVDLAAWRAAHGEQDPQSTYEDLADSPAIAQLSDATWVKADRRILDGASLRIGGTGVTTVIGPNGAGKSVMMRLLAGLLRPTSGSVSAPSPGAGGTALVFQKPVLLRRTLRANILHTLRIAGRPLRGRRAEADALLRVGGLEALADRPARALSGGEQQRAAMIRALALRPRLLLLDEPCANLDPHSTAAIEALIRGASESGVKVVLVTHDLGQARRMAREIVVVDRGAIAERTPVRSFFENPTSAAGRAYRDGRLLL